MDDSGQVVVVNAVAGAHRVGVVHYDIKPGNIVIKTFKKNMSAKCHEETDSDFCLCGGLGAGRYLWRFQSPDTDFIIGDPSLSAPGIVHLCSFI